MASFSLPNRFLVVGVIISVLRLGGVAEPLHLEVHGLLKIRGEITKSDVVAGLLATKARSSTKSKGY